MKVYSQDFSVHIHQTSFTGQSQLWAIFQWFQEAAANHATILEAGVEHLAKDGLIWVLLRLNLEINRMPEWREEMVLSTWVPEINGISTERHFRIVSKKDNNVLVNGASLWYAINLKTKKPSKLDAVLRNAHLIQDKAIASSLSKITIPAIDITNEFSVTARSGDIDIAHHVNNSVYVKWSSDAISLDEIRKKTIKEFQINFITETLTNDQVNIKRYDMEDQLWIEMTNNTGKRACLSSFSF